jgi:hypothetical protein
MNWMSIKSKDMFEKQTEISQEVLALSQAKGESEKELWSLPLGDYYATVAAFSRYSDDRAKKMKEKT